MARFPSADALTVALLLASLLLGSNAQIFGQVNCSAVKASSTYGLMETFDFSSLRASCLTPFGFVDPTWVYTYSISLFDNIDCGGKPTAVCQSSSSETVPLGVGFTENTPASWIKTSSEYPLGAVTFRLAPTGVPARSSTVTVVCDPKASYAPLLLLFHILLPSLIMFTSNV